jgi:DNA-binding transcriptional LysR family regulator
MNIDRLRYFAAVVETKNLRRASEILGLTPGSLSKAISTLEDEMGVDLLRPEGRGIEITDQGMEVYRKSSILLSEYRRFRENVEQRNKVSKLENKLRLGSFEVFTSYFTSECIQQEFPDYDVTVFELSPGAIEKAIKDDIIDVGLTYIPAPDTDLSFVQIGDFRMGVYGRPQWSTKPFEEWPFAIPTTPIRIHSQEFESLDLWPIGKKHRFVKYEFELLETALQTSRKGLSVLHCPDFVAHLHNRGVSKEQSLEELPYPKQVSRKSVGIFLVTKKSQPNVSTWEKKFARFCRTNKIH